MGNRRRSAFGPKKRREAKEDPPGGASTPPENPDRSSGTTVPPGPTAWWAWRCTSCSTHFVARCCAAVDGREAVWVWDYADDYGPGAGLATYPGSPPCPRCNSGFTGPIGKAPLPDDLEKDYKELMAMLKRPPPAPIIRKAEREEKKKRPDAGSVMDTDWIGVDE